MESADEPQANGGCQGGCGPLAKGGDGGGGRRNPSLPTRHQLEKKQQFLEMSFQELEDWQCQVLNASMKQLKSKTEEIESQLEQPGLNCCITLRQAL